jgi:dTDP-4-amino-4,6-dideoxygalactose transaminase
MLKIFKKFRKLERKFCEYINSRWAISFDSGRSGLYAILKCLGIKDYDEVILQAFTTVALSNVIQYCGAKPVFVDIEKETYNINPKKIEEKITDKTKVIIVQHTFGNPCEMNKIMEIAKKHNLFVIEDCAHSLGAEYQNKKLGTIGDVAFFSFGRDKIISSVAGGMVITNNNKIGEKIKEFRDRMPYPKKSLIIKQLLQPIITYKALKLYYFFNIGKIIMYLSVKFKIITKAYSQEEKENKKPENFPAKMPNALAKIALHQMKLINKFNNHRIKIVKLYQEKLENKKNIILPKSTANSKNVFLWFTILVENKKGLIKKAQKKHIILGDWFPQAIGPAEIDLEKCGYRKGDCPIAEEVSSKCVNLPTHFRMDEGDVEKVVEIMN